MTSDSIPVLDHGFVRLVDRMGDDQAIEQAARKSYGGGTRAVNDTRGLLRHLFRKGHTGPFEFCEIVLHIKAPIFVARQWMRHRTASIDEVSGRYSVLPSEFYLPEYEDMSAQATHNKQGRGQTLRLVEARVARERMAESAYTAFETYRGLLPPDEDDDRVEWTGLARELARTVLPLSTYTEWYWKIDLHNLLHFLQLRLDTHAQLEIRRYAEVIADLVKDWVPLAWEAFEDYRLGAVLVSAQELAILRGLLQGSAMPSQKASALSAREYREFVHRFNLG